MSELSELSVSNVWIGEHFPVGGRLPRDTTQVSRNYSLQMFEERDFHRRRNNLGQSQRSNCCHSLHVSFFFDGTNNNEHRDTHDKHPSNIAKLFHASMRTRPAERGGYYSYYMPGVGTHFPEIGELDYTNDGLKYATGGENRINWALVSLASALHTAIEKVPLSQATLKASVKEMSTWKIPMASVLGAGKRQGVMRNLLGSLAGKIERATPKPLGIKLYVYGFSRGAAEARTFITWLSQLLEKPEGVSTEKQYFAGLPISVEFLGLMDTVAAVGIANVAPFFAGHMDWADDTQLLPDPLKYPDFVKCCRHFVAAFEQRACFPLDSIRTEKGLYPPYAKEVVYPGVHSDIGGGYPKNDQGKARNGIDELVSQITLHDMYASAFAAGAPLQVPGNVLPDYLASERDWRAMSWDVEREFDISRVVISRFNAWRLTLPGITKQHAPSTSHEPVPLTTTLEQTFTDQLSWITGWRIGRFANGTKGRADSYVEQPFFTSAGEITPYQAAKEKAEDEIATALILKERVENKGLEANYPGNRLYEPLRDKTQLSEAAAEFKSDYLGVERTQTSFAGKAFDIVLRDSIYLLNHQDEAADHDAIRVAGQKRSLELFRDDRGTPSLDPDKALLVALFDDQIHDSRAWFMHDAMQSREMWGGYFFYRMLYFGNKSSRSMSPVVIAGQILGVAAVAGATVYGIKRGGALGSLGGFAAGMGAATIGYQVIDKVTGKVLPFLPGAEKLLQATTEVSKVAIEQKRKLAADDYRQRMERATALLRKAGNLVEFEGGAV